MKEKIWKLGFIILNLSTKRRPATDAYTRKIYQILKEKNSINFTQNFSENRGRKRPPFFKLVFYSFLTYIFYEDNITLKPNNNITKEEEQKWHTGS